MTQTPPFHSHQYLRECAEVLGQRLRVECGDLSPLWHAAEPRWPNFLRCWDDKRRPRVGSPRRSARDQSGDKSPHSITLALLAMRRQWAVSSGCAASPRNGICGLFFR